MYFFFFSGQDTGRSLVTGLPSAFGIEVHVGSWGISLGVLDLFYVLFGLHFCLWQTEVGLLCMYKCTTGLSPILLLCDGGSFMV